MPQALQNQSRRIVSIQVCRGLAALLVVLAHLHGIEKKYTTTNHLLLFEHGALGVDLFFVLSGIVIVSSTAGKFGSPNYAWVFLYHRLVRVFPIFWIYTTLTLIGIHFNPLAGKRPFNLIASYLLIPTRLPMLLLQGWTLSYEIYFYFVFFLLLLLVPERFARWFLALWGISVVALKLPIGLYSIPLVRLLVSPSVLEFLAGCILFDIYRRSRLRAFAGVLLLTTSLLWLTAIIVYSAKVHAGSPDWIVDGHWPRTLLYGTFATLFLLGAIELERTGIIRYLPLFASIGDCSYSIYLSHALILQLIGWLSLRFLPNHDSIFLIALIGLPSTLCVGYLSYLYVERPLLHLLYKSMAPRPIPAKQPASPKSPTPFLAQNLPRPSKLIPCVELLDTLVPSPSSPSSLKASADSSTAATTPPASP